MAELEIKFFKSWKFRAIKAAIFRKWTTDLGFKKINKKHSFSFFIWKVIFNSGSSRIKLSMVSLYEKGQIQKEPEPFRGTGENHAFFSTRGDSDQCFLFKNQLSNIGRDVHFFFPSRLNRNVCLKILTKNPWFKLVVFPTSSRCHLVSVTWWPGLKFWREDHSHRVWLPGMGGGPLETRERQFLKGLFSQ